MHTLKCQKARRNPGTSKYNAPRCHLPLDIYIEGRAHYVKNERSST